jgi:hypothetical protein
MDEVVDWERRTTHGSLDLDGCTEQSWWRSSSELVCYSSIKEIRVENKRRMSAATMCTLFRAEDNRDVPLGPLAHNLKISSAVSGLLPRRCSVST